LPYCPKCGNEVTKEIEYCPKCGASLKAEMVSRETYEKHEKHEKQEKHEKEEKAEKHEKGETSRFWALLVGLIIVVIGATSLVKTFFGLPDAWRGAFFLVAFGVIIISFAMYGVAKTSQRNPRP